MLPCQPPSPPPLLLTLYGIHSDMATGTFKACARGYRQAVHLKQPNVCTFKAMYSSQLGVLIRMHTIIRKRFPLN